MRGNIVSQFIENISWSQVYTSKWSRFQGDEPKGASYLSSRWGPGCQLMLDTSVLFSVYAKIISLSIRITHYKPRTSEDIQRSPTFDVGLLQHFHSWGDTPELYVLCPFLELSSKTLSTATKLPAHEGELALAFAISAIGNWMHEIGILLTSVNKIALWCRDLVFLFRRCMCVKKYRDISLHTLIIWTFLSTRKLYFLSVIINIF